MATLTISECDRDGLVLTLGSSAAAASGGDQWLNTGNEVLVISNTDSSPHNVFVTVQADPLDLAVTERTVTVTNATTQVLGPFPKNVYNDAGGYAQITYSAVTGMKVQVVNIPRG